MNAPGSPRTLIQKSIALPLTREETPAYLEAIQEQCTHLSKTFHDFDPTYVAMKNARAFDNHADMEAFSSPLHAAHCYSILLADRVGALAATIQTAVEILADNPPEALVNDPHFADMLHAVRKENIDALFRRATTDKRYIPEIQKETYSWTDMIDAMETRLDAALEAGEIAQEQKRELNRLINAIQEKLESLPLLEPILTGQAEPASTERISPVCITKSS